MDGLIKNTVDAFEITKAALAALETAALRFECIAMGCSPETASPLVGAKEIREFQKLVYARFPEWKA